MRNSASEFAGPITEQETASSLEVVESPSPGTRGSLLLRQLLRRRRLENRTYFQQIFSRCPRHDQAEWLPAEFRVMRSFRDREIVKIGLTSLWPLASPHLTDVRPRRSRLNAKAQRSAWQTLFSRRAGRRDGGRGADLLRRQGVSAYMAVRQLRATSSSKAAQTSKL
jgi:hypothetical protein